MDSVCGKSNQLFFKIKDNISTSVLFTVFALLLLTTLTTLAVKSLVSSETMPVTASPAPAAAPESERLSVLSVFSADIDAPSVRHYDVVVYGGTPSGVMAAVAAAGEGLKVAVIEPCGHLGGIISSGLCVTDIGNAAVVGGLAKDFFEEIGSCYGRTRPVYAFEPHVAENVFDMFVQSSGVDVFFGHRLKETDGVLKKTQKLSL